MLLAVSCALDCHAFKQTPSLLVCSSLADCMYPSFFAQAQAACDFDIIAQCFIACLHPVHVTAHDTAAGAQVF